MAKMKKENVQMLLVFGLLGLVILSTPQTGTMSLLGSGSFTENMSAWWNSIPSIVKNIIYGVLGLILVVWFFWKN